MWLGPLHQHPLCSGRFNSLGCCVAWKQHGSVSELESLFWTLDVGVCQGKVIIEAFYISFPIRVNI